MDQPVSPDYLVCDPQGLLQPVNMLVYHLLQHYLRGLETMSVPSCATTTDLYMTTCTKPLTDPLLAETAVQPQSLYWNGVETKHHGVVRYNYHGAFLAVKAWKCENVKLFRFMCYFDENTL